MKVALITRIMAHYREPIFSLLAKQSEPDPEFTFFADKNNNLTSVKTIDPLIAEKPVADGGFNWNFIKTFSLFNISIWQSGVLPVFFSKKYDVIILDTTIYYMSTWIGLVIAKLCKKKVIIWGHGFKGDGRGFRDLLRRLQYKLVDGLLLYGNAAKEKLEKKGFKPSQMHVVYNSLDYESQAKFRTGISSEDILAKKHELFFRPDLPVVLYIGRLSLGKKLDMILHTARNIFDSGKKYNILFVGDGLLVSNLKSLANDLLLSEYVRFYGPCYDEGEISKLISLANVTVVPDQLGLTSIHSLVYGVPVITSDNLSAHGPEYESIISGVNGSFYKIGSIESLSEEIAKWLFGDYSISYSREHCYEIVDKYYNPHYQQKVINNALNEVLSN